VNGDETKCCIIELTHSVIGGMYNVHTELGVGFAEPVYANALAVVLQNAGLRGSERCPSKWSSVAWWSAGTELT